MNNQIAPSDIQVSAEQRERIFKLYDDGLYMQAYRLGESIGPLARWGGTAARILAGRMAGNLGSARLADWQFIHAWRKDRTNPEAMWFFARYVLTARGPLAAWKFVNEHKFPADAPKELQSHWCSQQAAILGRLRDFDAAEEWLRKAEAFGEQAWTCLEWAGLYALEDRYKEAEAAARKALELRPWYRPALQWVAHFLVQQERDAEALDLLTQATGRLESSSLFVQLAGLQLELKRYDDVWHSLDEVERLAPLADKPMKLWLAARRCDLSCHRGDIDKAIEYAKVATGDTERNKSKFYEKLVTQLTNREGPGKRVDVPVGFVQQHRYTCAPASLVAISKFWSMPADHLEVAAEISYAGTPHHFQRKWLTDHGWATKEFTVTWETAVALIDRGIPFTLTTTEVTSAHMQAVVGYDSLRRTLIIRDPGERHRVEMAFDAMLQRYRSTGPRGMAMLPAAQQDKLDGLPLPDESLYDQLHKMEMALKEHRRDDAGQIEKAMSAQQPRHFVTLTAKRILAHYDTDLPAELMHTEQLLELFPDDLHLELSRTNILSVLGRYPQRLEILKRLAEKKESDPACWQQYAWELSADARQHTQALYLLRKAVRFNPMLARTYSTLARVRSMQRRFDEALQLFHFAACLEERDEYVAQDYFYEARAQGKTDQAIQFLQNRFERLGAQSAQPARTLYFATVQLGRFSDAFNVLERAMKLRPNDGELLTYAAEAHMHLADYAHAEELLEKAKGVSKPAARWRSLALLAFYQQDLTRARECWEEVVKIEPTAEDAHRHIAYYLAEREGRAAAVSHLQKVCERFPYHFNLNRMYYDWLFEDGPAAREKPIKKLIDIHPASVWARIELAYNLSDQERHDDADRALDDAEPYDSDGPAVWHARGVMYKKKQKYDDAQFAFREAIRKSVDCEPAIQDLIWLCENLQERREAVAFIMGELMRQRTLGGGLYALSAAQNGTPPMELLGHYRRFRESRPDLWGAWQVVTRQTGFCELLPERLERAQEAVKQFPAIGELWTELGEAHRASKNFEAEVQAHQRGVELAPYSVYAVRLLSEAHERAGAKDEAKKVIEQAIRRAPLVTDNYVEHAILLFRLREHDEAMKQIRHALKIEPWYDLAWNTYLSWCVLLDLVDEAIEMARGWTKSRPGSWRAWFRLARALQSKKPRTNETEESERIDQCTVAYDEAIKRSPRGIEPYDVRNPVPNDLHDLKAEMLGIAGRYDEATKACSPAAFKGKPPINLRGRAAWVIAVKGDYGEAKQQMVRVLRDDRYYQWGWDRLVDWSFTTHDFKSYHDAANEMLKGRPQSATALTYRGEALMRMDERSAGLDDLRAAQRKDPCNQLCTFVLFDEQMADEDYTGAETSVNSMQQNIAESFYHARPIQFHAKRGNQSTALDLFKDLCARTWFPPQSLQMAMQALDRADWKAQAEEIVREAMQQPQWPTDLPIAYASSWNPNKANDLPDRIAAIDRALERHPGTFAYLDLKADLLTNGFQFERAWQACQEKVYPSEMYRMEQRSAWVNYRSGRTAVAIHDMKKLCNEHPKDIWGWMQLADWYGRAGQWVDVLTVAEHMVVIAPRDPVGFGYRAQAKENLNDPQAAKADYIHALDIAPAYMFAAWSLFNIYVRAGEWQRMEKILEKAKKHADAGDWALRKVDSLIYQNKKAGFPAEFENLCKKATKSPWLIDQSLQFIVQAGWWSEAEEVLHRCLDLGPHITDPWVRLRVAMGDRTVGADVRIMNKSRPERTNCIAAYSIELAYAKDSAGLRKWIIDFEEELRADTPCWAKVGFALSVVQDWAGVVEWMSDYPEQPKALPGMLLPLIKSHRALGDVEDARKVSLHALTKLSPDYASSFHKVWLMYDQALEGDTLQVQRYLDTADLGGFDGYHQMINAMVRAMFLTMTNKETGFADARRILGDAARFAPPTVHDVALTGAYQRCVAEMARLRGTFWAKVWRCWRWLVPTLPQTPKVG